VNKQNNRSYITLKLATSIDFKTATSANESKWITGEKTREFSQQIRSKYQAIAVGVETIISDDPELNNRVNKNTYQPIKIVFDTNLRTPLQSKIFNQGKVIILTGPNQSDNNYPNNVKIIECKVIDQKIDLLDATQKLFDLGIGTILVEGGSKLISSFVWNDLYDEIDHFIAQKIIGESPKNAFNAREINLVSESTQLEIQEVQKIQEDIYINYRRLRCLQD
jgi:diaminohydroxyphosphoribosylaminopyrimidine deaminase/5-amino-6-(5-phosphoribosylamino)uracil reductase